MNVKMKLVAQGCAPSLAAAVAYAEIRRSQRSFQDHEVVIRDPASRRQVKLQEMEERRIVFAEFLNPGLTNTKAAGIRERRRERAH